MDKEATKPLNRIKVVLAEKGKPNKFLSDNLGVAPTTVSNGLPTPVNHTWRHP